MLHPSWGSPSVKKHILWTRNGDPWLNVCSALYTSDYNDGTNAGILYHFLWSAIQPFTVVPVGVLQPQQRQLPGKFMTPLYPRIVGDLYSACEVHRYGLLGDLPIFHLQVHNILVFMETPVQVDLQRVRLWYEAFDLCRWVDAHWRIMENSW